MLTLLKGNYITSFQPKYFEFYSKRAELRMMMIMSKVGSFGNFTRIFKMKYLVNEKSHKDNIFTVELEICLCFQKIPKLRILKTFLYL